MAPPHVLPDLLRPGLRVVICGSAAGAVSAARGAYYAGPGNKFWRILAEVKLTPRRLEPGEFLEVLNFGIGLTDLVKTHSGSDAVLPREANDVAGLIARIRSVRPGLIAFNGKRAAAVFYRRLGRDVGYGPGPPIADFPPIWVLPSTSGAACGSWSDAPWRQFADAVGASGEEFQVQRAVMQRPVRSVSPEAPAFPPPAATVRNTPPDYG
jgi:TDG/mug DNA glycosylase family protein